MTPAAVHLAYLLDRVLMHRGEPQLYGTQYHGVGNSHWRMSGPCAIPSGLDGPEGSAGALAEAADYRARLLAHQEQGGDNAQRSAD